MNTSLVAVTHPPSCPQCKTDEIEVIEYSDTVDFRSIELDVENLHMSKCKNCGHKWTTKEQRSQNNSVMREAYAIVRDDLRNKQGLLSGQQITHLRELFSLNQREAAAIFGGGYNAFNKYESGEVLQSYAMDRLLRLSGAVGLPAIEFLKNVFLPPNFIVISTLKMEGIRVQVSFGAIDSLRPLELYGTSNANKLEAPKNQDQFINKTPNVYNFNSAVAT